MTTYIVVLIILFVAWFAALVVGCFAVFFAKVDYSTDRAKAMARLWAAILGPALLVVVFWPVAIPLLLLALLVYGTWQLVTKRKSLFTDADL
jgi:hypothetical protein